MNAPSNPVRPTPPRLLEVVRTTTVTPRIRRISLGGEQIAGFPTGCHAMHLKVFLPRQGQVVPELPTLGPKGPVWPPADRRPVTRTYSVRAFREHEGELDIEFVLHGDEGPASRWAAKAAPGNKIGIAGPGGSDPMLDPDADWYWFAGDLSALPGISALLEQLPAGEKGRAFIEIPDASEKRTLRCNADVDIVWLERGNLSAGQNSILLDAVRATPLPSGRGFAWVAGESSAVISIRTHLRRERGFERAQLYSLPYWKADQSEEVYHEDRHRIMDAMQED